MIKLIGYSESEIERMERDLYRQYGEPSSWPREQLKDDWLLRVYGMAISHLAYGREFNVDEQYRKYHSYNNDITREDVETIWNVERKYFEEHVTVHQNTYTDDEGCSYNSLVWQ